MHLHGIHPNAFATELNKMIPAKIGHRYCIINRKTFLLLNVPPPYVTSSSILFTPTTLETKRQVAIAAIGIMTEFVRKSKKSKNCMPMIFTFPEVRIRARQTSQCDHDHATEHRRFFPAPPKFIFKRGYRTFRQCD